MSAPKRLLLLEDNDIDEMLLRRKLTAEWPKCEIVCVTSETGFEAALKAGGFDLILSDYMVPAFPGLVALALARERCPDVPFLFVSGAIGDEVAIESLKAGATDYVLKDRLARLVPSIRRALNETQQVLQKKFAVRRYESLVNSVDGIVWQADPRTLRFSFVSEQAERFLGYPVKRWLEEPDFWQNHIHPDDRQRAIQQCRQVTPERPHYSFEYRMLAANGEVIWLRDIVSIRLDENEATQLQGIMVNITARKEAEAARRDVQAKLERTNQVLSQRNEEIQNFYHTLSHELKTPLTSAREFISIVMDGLAGPLNETQMEYLGIAKESCDQLRACVNDMLDATRLETSKLALDLKPVCVSKLVQRVIASIGCLATEKQIVIRHELQAEMPDLALDERRITQVLTNLLSNAIKHTPASGTILIKAEEAPGRPELIQFSVSDNGCGIPKEEHDRIFDRLYQVKAGDATTEQGVGLGLYLCRELVQLHGGNIWVESQPGKGTTFVFVLPKSQQLLRSNVLIIDDDPDLLDILRQILAAEQYNVRTARDGREGLAEMRRQTPDVVLLDLAMPELTGAATLKEIRKDWDEVPVILHTAFADGELMKQALAFSPFTLLAKPCSPAQILETVRKVQRSGDTEIWKKNHHGLQRLPLTN
jgi:PAS domain S-box-containing protein